MSGTSDNAYLGVADDPPTGARLPRRVDPVFLAASVPARPGETVLELGCGVGTAALCLAARVPGLMMTGVELQADYAALARETRPPTPCP